MVNFAGGSDDGEVSQELVETIVNCNDFTPATVTIGTQVWMKYNLHVRKYRNGDNIPNVTDGTTWSNLTTGANCYYNNDVSHTVSDGLLYNWYAVNDIRGLAPAGFHVASDAEWTTLINYLGGTGVAGGKLKVTGTDHWSNPNTGATNESGFSAYPAGWRWASGTFARVNLTGDWWTSSQYNTSNSLDYFIHNDDASIFNENSNKTCGYSVRCVKDSK
ncbi:MAG: fibrobacter succinogenes major paralogous domain-containing protein [Bacteroidia bacterium]|nr:fibrobacter succinogenes major paralogous domain-containing protein [Bacteroidia bacterium]